MRLLAATIILVSLVGAAYAQQQEGLRISRNGTQPSAAGPAQNFTVKPRHVGLDQDSWGLDHGTWSVLAHVFPQADIPVVQLSIHADESIGYHMELGAKLAPLRDRGILVVCSGNVVHNLRRIHWDMPDSALEWGERFDQEVRRIMTSRPGDIASIERHPDYALAVPTPEHFLPLAYLCGLCEAAGQTASPFAQGGVLGSLTMTSYALGCVAPQTHGGAGASLPDPTQTPPEQTNT